MFTQEQASTVMGGTLYGTGGEKIGKIGQIFVDDATGRPEWVTVHTGLFGTNESFVPVADAQLNGNDLTVPFDKDKIKGAPNVDPAGGHLSEQEEDELYRYYGQSRDEVRGDAGTYDTTTSGGYTSGTTTGTTTGTAAGVTGTSVDSESYGVTDQSASAGAATGDRSYTDTGAGGNAYSGVTEGTGLGDRETTGTAAYASDSGTQEYAAGTGAGTVGHDVSGPTTDEAMTRSEERLNVGTQRVEAGRARLRKWVETSTETVTVPVSKERVTLETEPITEENRGAALDGPAISEEEHEVVLHEERPVVSTEAVPVERVRLGTEQTTEEQQVSGEVRKERIDLDDNAGVTADRDRNL